MIEPNEIENIIADNEKSLQILIRAIIFSQGVFSPILVRCNFPQLREQLVQKLHAQCPIKISELVLKEPLQTLDTTTKKAFNNEPPQALMIFGLELQNAIDRVILPMTQVNDGFRKNFDFPIIFWVNDQVLQQLIRLAPDFISWTAKPIEF